MSKEYSESDVKKLWKRIKPTKVEELQATAFAKGASSLYPEIDVLKTELRELRYRVERLEMDREPKPILVEKASPAKTKELVTNYLKEKGDAFPSDIANDLELSISDVILALQRLKEEKKVGEV